VQAVSLSAPSPLPGRLLRLVFAIAIALESWAPESRAFVGDPEEQGPIPYVFSRPVPEVAFLLHHLKVARLMGDTDFEANLLRRGIVHPAGAKHLSSEATRDAAGSDSPEWRGDRLQLGSDGYVGSGIELDGPQAHLSIFFRV